MPYRVSFTAGGADLRFDGVVSAATVEAALGAVEQHRAAGGPGFLLADYAAAAPLALTFDEARALAAACRRARPDPRALTAVVAPHAATGDAVRLCAEYASAADGRAALYVAATRAEAVRWLIGQGVAVDDVPAPD